MGAQEFPGDVDSNDGIIGCLPTIADPLHVREIDELVTNLPKLFENSCKNESLIEIAFLRYSRLLHLYQEQPNLLDELISNLIGKLINYVKLIDKEFSELSELSKESLKYISELCIVRGQKTIVRLLPHQVYLLEPLLRTLEFCTKTEQSYHQHNVLLLWLWIVVRNPFDLRRFDPTGDPNNVINRIMNIAMNYIEGIWNSSQYSASLVIAQCLSRSDGISKIPTFIGVLLERIKKYELNRKKLLSELIVLLAILKHVDRTVLVVYLEEIFEKIEFLFPIDEKRGTLICKCLVKVVQRIGLIALKPRKCHWSYKRGKRLLDDMFNENESKQESDFENAADEWDDGNDMDFPHIVEWATMHLLSSLSNSDTAVRWSAAKGIGRITARLPNADFASQVVESIVSGHFGETGEYSSWHSHGGCLALAELARRGALLPSLLETVIPAIEHALVFEDIMGRHQNANQVRDAACYVIWAFSRTYDGHAMKNYINRLANSLICCALFDREVNLRRAASAAFQEMVGRQKNVANGIDLLTLADYFSVTHRENCYTEICRKVSSFEAYSKSILDHLVNKKIVHWDEKIREQAALALEIISSSEIGNISDSYYINILKRIVKDCSNSKISPILVHGYLHSAAHLVKGLSSRNIQIDNEILEELFHLPICLKTNSDRISHTATILRKALCRFIEIFCDSKNVAFKTIEIKKQWMERVIVFLKDLSENTRNLAKQAANSFITNHFRENSKENLEILKEVSEMCLQIRNKNDEIERIGICMLCEILPTTIMENELCEALCYTILRPTPIDLKWASARKHAILAINRFCVRCTIEQSEQFVNICFRALYKAMSDYTTSSKGDIGRFVREASMETMSDILLDGSIEDRFVEENISQCVRLMVQQSVERIGRTRECSSRCIKRLIDDEMMARRIKSLKQLRSFYENPEDFILDSTIIRVKELLSVESYYDEIVLGLVVSAGGLGEGTQKCAKQVLLDHQREVNSDKNKLDKFLGTIGSLFEKAKQNSRIGNSLMQILPQIFANLGIYEDKPESSQLIVNIIEIMKSIFLNSEQISRQRLSIDALGELLNAGNESGTYKMARTLILQNLYSSRPILRKVAAEKLYEHFCCAEEIDEDILQLLSTTNWQEEENMVELKRFADQISEKLE